MGWSMVRATLLLLAAIAILARGAESIDRFVIHPIAAAPTLGIRWKAVNDSLSSAGLRLRVTIEHPNGMGWVGIGGNSDTGMSGPVVVCAFTPARCVHFVGDGFTIRPRAAVENGTAVVVEQAVGCLSSPPIASTSSTSSMAGSPSVPLCTLTFEHPVETTAGRTFRWGTAGRVIFAFGEMAGDRVVGHRGSHIGAALIDFSRAPEDQAGDGGEFQARPSLPWLAMTLAWTLLLVAIIQGTALFRCRVHHRLRAALGAFAVVIYVTLWLLYVAENARGRQQRAAVDARATALGDGCAMALGVMLITGSRRFIGQEIFTVSHERMILYHTATGVAFVLCLVGHVARIVTVYQVTILVQTDQLVCTLIGLLAVLMFTTAMLRHRLSFALFRVVHFSWIAIVGLSILHAPVMVTYCCIPGLVSLSCTGVSMLLSILGSRVESVHHLPGSGITVVDVSRCHFSWLGGGREPTMGIGPGQWCYVSCLDCRGLLCGGWGRRLGPLWHPFTVARADVRWPPGGGWPRQHLRFIIKATTPVPSHATQGAHANNAGGYASLRVGGAESSWTNRLAAIAAEQHSTLYRGGVNGPPETIELQVIDDSDSYDDDADDDVGQHNEALAVSTTPPQPSRLQPHPPVPNSPLAYLVAFGPYGRIQVPLLEYPTVIMASGGVGATPHLLGLQYLARMLSVDTKPTTATPTAAAARRLKRVVWLWIVRDPDLLQVCAQDLADYAGALRNAGVNVHFGVTLVIGDHDSNEAVSGAHFPFAVDRRKAAVAVDVQLAEAFRAHAADGPIAVTSCGPVRFMAGVRHAIASTERADRRAALHLHEEVFSL